MSKAQPIAQLDFLTQRHAGAASVGDLVALPRDGVGRITRLDSRSRTASVQPVKGATQGGLDKAKRAFRSFSGHEPAELIDIPQPAPAAHAWLLGELEAVTYRATRDGRSDRYHHEFKRAARPVLAVTVPSAQLVVIGGRYTVTDAGITDHS